MPLANSPSGTYQTPDADEAPQLDYWLAQLAAQVEKKAVSNTTGTRSRVHVQTGLTATTDASGYGVFNHGAPFTPRACQVLITNNASSLAYLISSGSITSTQVTARFGAWNTTNILANASLGNGSITVISWE